MLDPDALLPAAILQRAIEDVQEYAEAIQTQVSPGTLEKKARYALKALNWLFVDRPAGHYKLGFEEACTLAGCTDCPSFREKLKTLLPLKEIVPSLLPYCS